MVPVALTEELLEDLSVLVVEVGDGLGVLAGQVGEESLDVAVDVAAQRRAAQGVEEGLQAGQDAAQQAGGEHGVVAQVVQAESKAGFHDRLLGSSGDHPTPFYANVLRRRAYGDTVEMIAQCHLGKGRIHRRHTSVCGVS